MLTEPFESGVQLTALVSYSYVGITDISQSLDGNGAQNVLGVVLILAWIRIDRRAHHIDGCGQPPPRRGNRA